MTGDLRYERIVATRREVAFDAFTSVGGQIAFYGQDDPGWIVRAEHARGVPNAFDRLEQLIRCQDQINAKEVR